ncbi:MAG TPA: rod shape-determining protein MreD [Mycobacteriales bacterium]|nr:rod shape-determining protein MreD [Mycobacteriales bacterium]
MRRSLLTVAVVLTALLLQAAVVNRLQLPGTGPDLLVLVVVAFGLAAGPTYGVVLGFFAGLAADVLPPADHSLGRLALALAVVGYLAGLVEDVEERSVLTTVAVVAIASGAAVVLYAGVGGLVGDHRITASAVAHSLASTVIYDVVLAPFVVPLLAVAVRRTEPAA